MTTNDPIALIPRAAFRQHVVTKFSPKLEFDERCAILALSKSGVIRDLLSTAFGVDRRTVSHIVNPQSPHYKEVRKEYARLGHEEFVKKYVTEEISLRIAAAHENRRVEAEKEEAKPSRRSNRYEGMQRVQPEQCSREHIVEIAWLDTDEHPAGWYYRDTSSDEPTTWLHNGDDSRRTSKTCLDALLINLLD